MASLKSAVLDSAVLVGADFRNANLTNCRLTKAMLTGVDLTGADLTKTDFRGARGLMPEQIRSGRNWGKAVLDDALARSLDITQDVETSRHGAKPAKGRKKKRTSLSCDVVCSGREPTFGDLFVICGDQHPQFSPSGICDLSTLASLGFEQADDFFAIMDSEGEPIIWLYPLVKNRPVHHHQGPFDGIRLESMRMTKKALQRYVAVVSRFVVALEGTLRLVDENGRSGEPLTLDSIRQEFGLE
jgi:uncharacterized protein YjbI with pentapeptide repeats